MPGGAEGPGRTRLYRVAVTIATVVAGKPGRAEVRAELVAVVGAAEAQGRRIGREEEHVVKVGGTVHVVLTGHAQSHVDSDIVAIST